MQEGFIQRLRRISQRENRWVKLAIKLWPVVAVVILVAIAFYPVVAQNRSLLGSPFAAGVMGDQPPYGVDYGEPISNQHQLDPGASAWQDEPWTEKGSQLYKEGDLPLWNSSQALGKPLAAAMQSAIFFPLKALVFLEPTPLVWNIYLLLRIAIAIGLCFIFLRLVGLRKISSLAGATIFGLSGHYIFFVAEAHLNVDIVLPLLFIGFELIARRKSGGWPWLAVAVFLMAVGGHPETALVGGTFGFLYFLYRLAIERDNLLRKIGSALLGLGLGVGLSMFLFLPFWEFVGYAYTIHGPDDHVALGHDLKSMVINLFYPFFYGWPYQPWSDQYGAWSGTRNYVGITALFLMAVSIFDAVRYRRYIPIFIVLFLIAITKQFGLLDYSWLIHIPFYSAIGYPKYLGPVVALTGAVLAAFGVNALLEKSKGWRPWILVVPALLLIYTIYHLWPFLKLAPANFENKVAIQLLLPALVASGALIAALIWRFRPKFLTVVGVVLAIGAVVEMVILVPNYWPKRVEPYGKPPYVSFLQEKGIERIFATDYLLYPNTSSVFGLYDIRDLDAVFVTHYFRYIQEFINPSVVDRYTGMPENSEKENLPTMFRDNPFFNLLNVRYIATKNQAITDTSSSLARQLVDGVISANVGLRTLTSNDETRPVVFEHPDTTLNATVIPGSVKTKLLFSIAVDQSTWEKVGDGVRFQVKLAGNPTPLYDFWLDARANPDHRRWIDGEIDLGRYAGQPITLEFKTLSGANNMNDLAGWSRLRLSDEPVRTDGQYKHVYGDEVNIYENTHAFPRAFLVGDVTSRANEDEVVAAMKDQGFDPRLSAVVESDDQLGLASKDLIGFERTTIKSYKDQQVILSVNAPTKSFLVLSDTYYPGWKAFIDGKETKVYQTNLALRGVVVDAGIHEVEFRYQPDSFRSGLYISLLSLIAGLAILFRNSISWLLGRYRIRSGSGSDSVPTL